MVFVYTKTHLATEIRIAKLLRISLTKKLSQRKMFLNDREDIQRKNARGCRLSLKFRMQFLILHYIMQRHKKALKTAGKPVINSFPHCYCVRVLIKLLVGLNFLEKKFFTIVISFAEYFKCVRVKKSSA